MHFGGRDLANTPRRCYNADKAKEGGDAVKITVWEDPTREEAEICVTGPRESLDEILAALAFVGETIAGRAGEELAVVPLASVYYFETVDDRLFFYTAEETYECPARLKAIEERLAGTPLPFARISKTAIANLSRMKSIRPEKNSRLVATLKNGEQLVVNRQYVKSIKEKLGV